ncbi:DUF4252 domain-containing protein [Robertkochia solimangrovi]|uniref:DUF4252 domain-containing protein n=1 Tax=Robertkochia solimangrovi TaxID=2213046 RepID=UPI00117BFC7F|nr:DUF4252 domain-containing protein [Robertkochia solimangrovi]TRZ43649.1 DUF4252 domain-containing protein [Robertkochia solimangrovi]
MKKIVLIIALAVMPVIGFGQSIFEKYESSDDVSYVTMQPKMFQLLAKMSVSTDDPEAQEFFKLVNSITSFKVLTTDKGNISSDINQWVTSHLKSSSLEELMRVKDGETNVKFYVKQGKDENHVKELLMFVTGIDQQDIDINGKKLETVLLSLTGDIDLRQISKLTESMNLPGGDQLGKASKSAENK